MNEPVIPSPPSRIGSRSIGRDCTSGLVPFLRVEPRKEQRNEYKCGVFAVQ